LKDLTEEIKDAKKRIEQIKGSIKDKVNAQQLQRDEIDKAQKSYLDIKDQRDKSANARK
jgi:uncharacterized phage infection (PIP) family protein YhgE